eukprot:1494952-Pleurochrysis_carterae.AAC.1
MSLPSHRSVAESQIRQISRRALLLQSTVPGCSRAHCRGTMVASEGLQSCQRLRRRQALLNI